ncbi:carboxylating nicotinate-nucleotide diphosphorylase [Clostridium oryzae]|uniref:carboxylating nicotinate-nucleotide diphosphorylase n=1 Tax=Clostridium oryzae TaxID=1450648 RepID=UPI001A9A2E27|nr:carboxylating nicotinate-nucleotide diphosphorylase [Clostridium oryzae]
MNFLFPDQVLLDALKEDIPWFDITSTYIVGKDSECTAELLAKETGIAAGLDVFGRVFELLGGVTVTFLKKDGDLVTPGEKIALLSGNTLNILQGERTALNFLQRMSGIATLTRKFVNVLEGSKAKLLDTRKTTPGLRIFEKYAVKVGGGENHRFGLSDGILIKDNHIGAAGGIKNAIEIIRKNTGYGKKIEIEVENMSMVKEAVAMKADIIMLDNMSVPLIKEAVDFIDKRAITECSGNVNIDTISQIAATGIDYISVGELTHSARILDFSLKNLVKINEA